MTLPPMPWRLTVIATVIGAGGGAVFGLVRGLSYLPTLPFAVAEGALLFGIPAALIGLAIAAAYSVGSAVCRRSE